MTTTKKVDIYAPVKFPNGPFMCTFGGRIVGFDNPDPSQIDIEDIAHHLSGIPRYNFATKKHYSVAQHCVLCAQIAEADGNCDIGGAFIHDFSEAYIGDLTTGLCRKLNELSDGQWALFKDSLDSVISSVFGIRYPWHTSVRIVDQIAFSTEVRDLFPQGHPILLVDRRPPIDIKLVPATQVQAEKLFLARYKNLRSLGLLK